MLHLRGKKLEDFNYQNVDAAFLGYNNLDKAIFKTKLKLLFAAKDIGAEVVVSIKPTIAYHTYHYIPIYMMGTALIRKK